MANSGSSRLVVITGVSTGIGYQLCKDLLAKGDVVYGSVRSEADRERLNQEIPDLRVLIFDVTQEKQIKAAAEVVENENPEGIDILVNNAGMVVSGPLLHVDLQDFDYQIQVNVLGVLKVCQAFCGLLGARDGHERKPGKIVQISSVSGKIGMPFVGPYVASKFALEGMSESLRRELLLYGIDVIVIGPGAVKTPIWHKRADEYDRFKHTDYGSTLEKFREDFIKPIIQDAIPVEELSGNILEVLENNRPKTRYTFVRNKWKSYMLPRLLPRRWVDRVIKRKMMWE